MNLFQWSHVDDDIFEILIKYHVVVFGGYVRDSLLGINPKDIDCVVELDKLELVHDDLLRLGYQTEHTGDATYRCYLRPEHKKIDLWVSGGTIGGLEGDIDINNLSLVCHRDQDGHGYHYEIEFFREIKTITCDQIIKRLRAKEMYAFSLNDEALYRLSYMQYKGFKIYPHRPEIIYDVVGVEPVDWIARITACLAEHMQKIEKNEN
jgi:hypothetical protein